jgi:hypothetical protein
MEGEFMVIKKCVLLILTVSIFTVSGNALEREKPLPLKELQNPNGPSYVPIPYPKNNNEVITDLKYYMKSRVGNVKHGYIKGDMSSFDDFKKICVNFLGNKGITVGEILKIKNKLASRERDYAFLIRLKNEKNYGIASFGTDANGIIFTSSYIDLINLSFEGPHLQEMIFKPIGEKTEFIKQLKQIIGYDLDVEEKNRISLVEGISQIGDTLSPAWKAELKNGRIFFKSHRLNAVYEVIEKLNTTDQSNKAKAASIMRNSEFSYQSFDHSSDDEKLILREVFKER